MKKVLLILLNVFCFIFLFSCEKDNNEFKPDKPQETVNDINWQEAADKSSQALLKRFWNLNKKYFNCDSNGKSEFHYWPQAHALEILIDAYERNRNKEYKTYFSQWFEGVKTMNGNTFHNDYYDDMQWNALAILRAYNITKESKYKEAVLQLWDLIIEGWNENAGGGIAWKKGMEYSKNACSNAPACILAARLYRELGDEKYKNWAIKIYNWQKNTLFNSNNGAVYDNINSQSGKIEAQFFTYNQGTFIGAAIELHKIFNEKSYLNDSVLAANYTIGSLVDNGILKDEGNGDGGLFKGIFIRYFTELIQQDRLDATIKKRYIQFLKLNAETLWTKGTDFPSVLFGTNWKIKPTSSTGLTEQLSGCMLIEAIARLDKNKFLD